MINKLNNFDVLMYFINLSILLSFFLFRSTVTLATYFETLYPGSILHVRLCQDLQYLDALVTKRSKVVMKLERAIAILKKTGLNDFVLTYYTMIVMI